MRAVFRPIFGRVLAASVAVLSVGGLVMTLAYDGAGAAWQAGPWLALACCVAWALYWRPEVAVDDAGVHLVNVLRTIDLPWPSIREVGTRWSLTLVTSYGTYTAWAAPAPGGLAAARAAARRDNDSRKPSTGHPAPADNHPVGSAKAAAGEVRRRWEDLRDAGHLDDPRLEFDRPPVRWHWETIVGVVGLLVLGVLAALSA